MFIYSLNEIYNPNALLKSNSHSLDYPLIVFVSNSANNFPEELKKLLTNILKALKLDFSEILLIHEEMLIDQRVRNVKNKTETKIISFGIHPQKIGLNLSPIIYELIQFQDIQFILANDLEDINTDPTQKQKLWGQLQIMFGLK